MSRSIRFRLATSLLLVASVGLTSGCVTRAKYDAMKRERDVYAAQGETLTRETEELADVAATLEEEVALRDEQITILADTQQGLEAELETLIVAGLVKIALLRDGLHVMLSEEVLFSTGSSQLNEGGRRILGNMIDDLREFPYQIAILGYTDALPIGASLRDRYPSNWELAASRAGSVVRLLEGGGIASEQLVLVSFGSNRPFAPNDTVQGRRQNRRIELRLRPVVAP
ncbi:MAG: OmpA family protein [Deltaproteobacteria bacterium]|nr:OmpA family protein [Deltaproteobacteria bacterium]